MSDTGSFSLQTVRPLRAAARMWRGIVDSLLPAQCMLCNSEVDEPGRICVECWPSLSFIAAPFCPSCGMPFAVSVPEGLVCGACMRRPPRFARARAVFVYDGGGRELVLRFKRGDRTDLAPGLAGLMRQAGAELLADCDLIAPVPLHPRRLWRRRFNQSGLLAGALGRLGGKPVQLDLLLRRKFTRSLGHAGRLERRRILAGAIVANPKAAAAIRGRRILLIDDVLTTGATASACCRTLLQAGAASVDVLTLARVVRPE